MDQKKKDRIKQTLIFIAWGLFAMAIIFALMFVAAVVGWGI